MSDSRPRGLLTDIPGIRVGHAEDLAVRSGVTAILFDRPVVASVDVRGGGPGTRETDLLDPERTVDAIDALVLSGGSAFGLDAASGVTAWLARQGRGFPVGGMRVPIVPAAILFDLLNGGDKDWGRFSPYRELGYQAARAAAAGAFSLGSVGAGTGATTATVKGGLGSASTVTAQGHRVAAIMAVNAVGTPLIGDGPWFWAAPFECGDEFGGRGLPEFRPEYLTPRLKGGPGTATTIGLVVTDAALSKVQARRLATMGDDGLARAILPAHAPTDGDTLFAASTGTRELHDPIAELTQLGHAATQVVARAVARAIYHARSLAWPGAQPAWVDRFESGKATHA
jgi:L-aminopeptidase/D-esterase-like protein